MSFCPVKLTVNNEDRAYTDVKDGEASTLQSGFSGSAQILWKEEGFDEFFQRIIDASCPVGKTGRVIRGRSQLTK